MRVADVMTAPVRTISADDTAPFAWEQMRVYGVRHLVVVDAEGRLSGVLSASDLGGVHGEPLRKGRRVTDLMTQKVVTAAPNTTVREAANLLRGNIVNCLPIIDRGKVTGMVTALDLLELIGRGAERPVTTASRRVLKDRGQRPHGVTRAKETHNARMLR